MFDSAKAKIGDGTIDLNSHAFKMVLTSNSYTPTRATHDELADVTNEVANGNGYTSGGAALANPSFNQTSGTAKWDADDVSWTASGGSIGPIRNAVIYDDTVSGDPLVCYCVLEASDLTITDGQTMTVQFSASGILTLSGATS